MCDKDSHLPKLCVWWKTVNPLSNADCSFPLVPTPPCQIHDFETSRSQASSVGFGYTPRILNTENEIAIGYIASFFAVMPEEKRKKKKKEKTSEIPILIVAAESSE
jgi:hypothetical protein